MQKIKKSYKQIISILKSFEPTISMSSRHPINYSHVAQCLAWADIFVDWCFSVSKDTQSPYMQKETSFVASSKMSVDFDTVAR